jgi:hypothetical protein
VKNIRRIKTVTRVQKKNAFGIDYYPRIEVSGQELELAGFHFGEKYEVIIDIENKRMVITPFKIGGSQELEGNTETEEE